MVITSVVKQSGNSSRYNIYIDYNYSFSADYAEILSLSIKENTIIDQEELKSIIYTCQYNKAYNKALRILSIRPRSEYELRKKLQTAEFNDSIIDEVIERLIDLNYINDAQYAKMWVEGRKRAKPTGKKKLIQELNRKGIDLKLVNQIVEETAYDDMEVAIDILKRKLKGSKTITDIKEYSKLYRYLLYRGIGYDTAYRAVKNFFDRNNDDFDEI